MVVMFTNWTLSNGGPTLYKFTIIFSIPDTPFMPDVPTRTCLILVNDGHQIYKYVQPSPMLLKSAPSFGTTLATPVALVKPSVALGASRPERRSCRAETATVLKSRGFGWMKQLGLGVGNSQKWWTNPIKMCLKWTFHGLGNSQSCHVMSICPKISGVVFQPLLIGMMPFPTVWVKFIFQSPPDFRFHSYGPSYTSCK